MIHHLSFRFRIVALVLGVAIVPLVLSGAFLLRGASRSGEQLLSQRLERATEESRLALISRWLPLRSMLLDVSEWPEVRRVAGGEDGDALLARLVDLDPRIRQVTIRAPSGERMFGFDRATLPPEQGGQPPANNPLMRVTFELFGVEPPGAAIDFGVEGDLLLPAAVFPPSTAGMVLTLLDPEAGSSLLPIPLDAYAIREGRFVWGGEEWLASMRVFVDPPVRLVVAAPLTPYVAPFRRSVRNGAFLLAAVAVGGLLAAVVLTSRMTRSLRELVGGAEAVSAGDLSHRIGPSGADEIGRVAEAFNQMTASLQRTLREKASRESLAAMGEFAASLAHEVRNPLTAVKIDLQSLQERLADDDELAVPLRRALEEIDRLDSTVGDALSVVRRGEGERVVDLWQPIRAAAHSASPAFAKAGAILEVTGQDDELPVRGDAAGLEQLFLNLLLNAAEALSPGGRAAIGARRESGSVLVRVEDDGPGIPAETRERIFEPLFSTKEAGTGLGLTISRRIVEAHRGDLSVGDHEGGGTRVEIRLPLADADTPPKALV
jgi:signal transduction histidine kinase